MVKKKEPEHKMGNRCGYEEYEDGRIKVAPTHSQLIDEYIERRETLGLFLNQFMDHYNEMLAMVNKLRNQFWRDISEDYPFIKDKKYGYIGNGIIKPLLEEEEKKGGSDD